MGLWCEVRSSPLVNLSKARYLVAVEDPDGFVRNAEDAGIPATVVGKAAGNTISVAGAGDLELAELRAVHEGWMPSYMA